MPLALGVNHNIEAMNTRRHMNVNGSDLGTRLERLSSGMRINGADDGKIVTDYRRHVAWQSAEEPGGYEQDNVDFILGFDCGLLEADHADAH